MATSNADRARHLAHMAFDRVQINRIPQALDLARQAQLLAQDGVDEETEGLVLRSLALALLETWQALGDDAAFDEALAALRRAATLLEWSRSPRYVDVLLDLAEVNRRLTNWDMAGRFAAHVLGLLDGDGPWGAPEASEQALAWRGSAHLQLGLVAAEREPEADLEEAGEQALEAASLLLDCETARWAQLETIAHVLEAMVGDVEAAAEVRAAAAERWPR
jgi:hypothetical protein